MSEQLRPAQEQCRNSPGQHMNNVRTAPASTRPGVGTVGSRYRSLETEMRSTPEVICITHTVYYNSPQHTLTHLVCYSYPQHTLCVIVIAVIVRVKTPVVDGGTMGGLVMTGPIDHYRSPGHRRIWGLFSLTLKGSSAIWTSFLQFILLLYGYYQNLYLLLSFLLVAFTVDCLWAMSSQSGSRF